jgi:hypothetical protein
MRKNPFPRRNELMSMDAVSDPGHTSSSQKGCTKEFSLYFLGASP